MYSQIRVGVEHMMRNAHRVHLEVSPAVQPRPVEDSLAVSTTIAIQLQPTSSNPSSAKVDLDQSLQMKMYAQTIQMKVTRRLDLMQITCLAMYSRSY